MGSIEVPDFNWTEVRPGRWERDIDEVEQFYTSLAKSHEASGRCFFAITGYISFAAPGSNQEVEDALRKAWLRMRYDHPTVGSRVEFCPELKRCRKIYETFQGPESQQAWLDSTFRVVATSLSGLQWCNSDPPVPPTPTLFLIRPLMPSRGQVKADLVLRCHHNVVDGIGTLLLFNNLFRHAAHALDYGAEYSLPVFGDEWKNLSPPLHVAAGIPTVLTPERQARLERTIAHNADLKRNVEIATMPFRRGRTSPGKHQRAAITLSTEQTQRLLKACKVLGLSVTHAYHTAIAVVLRDIQRRGRSSRMVRYISYSLVNERPHCVQPYSTPAHAVSAYHSVSGRCLVVDLKVPGSMFDSPDSNADSSVQRRQEFMRIAGAVRKFYLQTRNDTEHINMVPSYWAMGTIPYPSDNKTPPLPKPNEAPSVSVSSMGTLDTVVSPNHGLFELDNPWVTGEELGAGLGLFLGTWKGQLTLSAAYNDAWHSRHAVLAFIERCNIITIQALGA